MSEIENDFERDFVDSPHYGKYLKAMAEEQTRLDPDNMETRITELEKLVKTLTNRVEELETPEEPVHASALCEAETCTNCGACDDYLQNGGRI
ncbi:MULTISPECIES: hypothetical protein [Methanobacterium]|uniref:Uncharacterized protein n=1 Tax=Methanobacterium bryantii TaxID=2161 RepID=A0A2A2H8S2_METBR|nr:MULTISPECIES: hypothetical protein [Methanobacterium]OEC87849.1 hypothetical protein A9507_06655 [Methanobacterium sp. A39]PAV05716.1 hypothetical protein ASJ80_08265 [Methanobacterium bryantii]